MKMELSYFGNKAQTLWGSGLFLFIKGLFIEEEN